VSEIPGTNGHVTWESALRGVVRSLAYRRMRTPKNRRLPLWSMVGELTGNGSGYSAAICRACGYNSDSGEELAPEVWEAPVTPPLRAVDETDAMLNRLVACRINASCDTCDRPLATHSAECKGHQP
jgi:hypothetical protein